MMFLSTEKLSSGTEVRGSSWWGMANKNKFVLLQIGNLIKHQRRLKNKS